MKNIVFVIESLHLGGAEKTLITLLNNLDYSQYNVDLITFHNDGFFREFVPEKVNQIVFPFPKLSIIDRIRYKIKRQKNKSKHDAQLFWPIISSYFKKIEKQYDVAIAYNQGFVTYFVSEFVTSICKYAWLNINYKIANYEIDFDYQYYKKFNKIICVSEEVKIIFDEIQHQRKYKLETQAIKDIVEHEEIVSKATEPIKVMFSNNKVNIVSVGRLAKQKAFDLAISACKLLVDRGYDINWFVVGEGNERESLENMIAQNNLVGIFYLLGAQKNPYPYVKNTDYFVQTSRFEGLGTTLIEASLLCKPIVTTNFPSAFNILENEKTGLIVEMNASEIANAIERLILNEELKNTLVSNLEKQENRDKEKSLQQINDLLN